MAAYRPAALSILCCFFFFFFLLTPFSSASKITHPSDSHKVSLALYYESLCPYSANFIVNYLPKLFEDDLISIVDLRLVPWGNARLKGNDTFDCQVFLNFQLDYNLSISFSKKAMMCLHAFTFFLFCCSMVQVNAC